MVMSERERRMHSIDAAGGVADLQAEVPEQIEDEFDDALAPGVCL